MLVRRHRFVEDQRNHFETGLKAFEALGRQHVQKAIAGTYVR
jgi:hypothetical protein